jgi:hypothetical protein
VAIGLLVAGNAPAAQDDSVATPVWAYVQGLPIGEGEVRYLLSQLEPSTTGQRSALDTWLTNPEAKPTASAEVARPALPPAVIEAAVEQWIERLVVLAFLERNQLASSAERVAAELETLDQKLREAGSSLEAYCGRSGIRREALQRHLQWDLSWSRYVARRVTDESLEKFYNLYPGEFDGRRRQLAHIVLPWSTGPAAIGTEGDDESDNSATADGQADRRLSRWPKPLPEGAEERSANLASIRQRILAGEMTFAAAAALYSQGATAAEGGDLGWVIRQGPLSEAVSRAAFRLKIGEISPPIVSPHGVHLITVLAEEPGSLSFAQAKDRVKRVAIEELWQTILQQESARLSIEFSPPTKPSAAGG